jgi:cytochrome c oxidase subunit 1
MTTVAPTDAEFVRPAEVEDVELYHAKSWVTKYVFSQDAKVIAIQYSFTAIAIGLVGLVLSWLMRLQLGFPDSFDFIDATDYYQFITMHGMIMVIYLLTALFLGGFGNYLIPLMVGARDMVFPYVNMLSYWIYLLAVLVLVASWFVPGGPTGAGWTLYPPQAILSGTPGSEGGILLMLISLALFIVGFTMGGLNYVTTVLQARTRGMTLMRMPLTIWGIFTATVLALLAFPALFVGAVMMTASWGPASSCRPLSRWANSSAMVAAAHCCFSTCSGFSAIPRSISSPCPLSVSSPTCSASMRDVTSSATG